MRIIWRALKTSAVKFKSVPLINNLMVVSGVSTLNEVNYRTVGQYNVGVFKERRLLLDVSHFNSSRQQAAARLENKIHFFLMTSPPSCSESREQNTPLLSVIIGLA